MTVYWLIDDHEFTEPPLAAGLPAFLHPFEVSYLNRRLTPKRRAEWLHGRWVAKTLLQEQHPDCKGLSLTEIVLASEAGGAPYASRVDSLQGAEPASPLRASEGVKTAGTRLPGCLSLSHSGPLAACALSLDPAIWVGIDLELVEPRSLGVFADYFTEREMGYIRSLPDEVRSESITLIWSAKEAVLKALRLGLAVDTRQIEVAPAGEGEADASILFSGGDDPGGSWNSFAVSGPSTTGSTWKGRWRLLEGYLLTLAVAYSKNL